MMISERFNESVYIADFTDYNNSQSNEDIPFKGVVVSATDNGILSSFELTNVNKVWIERTIRATCSGVKKPLKTYWNVPFVTE